MIEHALTDVTLAQTDIVLQQVTQGDVFEYIQDDTLLSSSLWANIALAGLSILLFVAMGRKVESTRARMIWVATLMVPLVSISSYASLVSGLTAGFVEMPAGHALEGATAMVGGEEVTGVFQPWGRYLTWTFSTPFILAALGMVAGTDRATLFTAIAMDIGMCVTGLAAALIESSHLLRWVFFGISCAFFLAVIYVLLVEWPEDAAAAGTADIFNTLKILTVILWLGYPLIWAVGAEGLALVESAGLTSWGYSALDILAKYVFAFLLLRWVAANESVVSGSSGLGAPADD